MAKRYAPRGPVKAKSHPMDGQNPMDVRCTATNRQGNRCGRRPIPGGTVCVMHGGGAPQVKAAAEARLEELRQPAIAYLGHLLAQHDFPSAGLGAAKDVLDRLDGKPHESVSMDVTGSISINERIAKGRERARAR